MKPKIKLTSLCSNFVECKIEDSKVLVFEIHATVNLKEMTCVISTDIMINDKISESVPNALKFDIKPGDFYGNSSSFNRGLGQFMLDFEMVSVVKTDLKNDFSHRFCCLNYITNCYFKIASWLRYLRRSLC